MQKVTVNDNKPVVVATGGGGEAIATCGVGEAIAKCDGGDVATAETQKTKKLKNKNRIHVSHTKRPFFFYCNLAKRYIKQYNAVELSALGMGTDNLFDLPPFHPFLLWSQLLRVSRAMELLSRRVSRYLTSNIPRLYQKNMTAIDTYDDHRMAMAFSLAACGDVPVIIKDPGCTRKTFPDYFEVLGKFTKH